MDVDLTTSLGSLELASPTLTASGCAAAGRELAQFGDVSSLGAVVTKSIMMEPRSGRATPRMAETPSGMLNSIGLQGPGIEAFLEKDLSWLTENNVTTIVSIAGNNVDEFGELARILAKVPGIAGLEVNISCPNVESRGQVFACNPVTAAQVIETVCSVWHSDAPVLAKLSPDVTDIVEIAHSVVEAGVTGVSMINTLLGMVIDVDKMKPMLGGRTGGLSGPAIRPVAVRAIYQVHAAIPNLPILGMGGIRTGHDALEFIAAGASAVSIGTVVFGDPGAPWRIANELGQELQARGYDSLREVIGLAHHN
ncbi:MAG: dihydroorotate dehydrogenase [Actinomycetes bacterium]